MRTIDPATQAHIDTNKDSIIGVLCVDLDLKSGAFRVNTSGQSIYLSGEEFVGVGALGTVSSVEDSTEVQSASVTCTLSGVPPELVSIALSEHYQGRDATIFFAVLDRNYQLVGDAITLFKGRMDNMSIGMGGEAQITVSLENRWADWERPRVSRYNMSDQLLRYPHDLGLQFIEQTVDKELDWG